MKRIPNSVFFFLMAGSMLFGQQNQKVPFDPSVETGVLKNGFTYFIKHNEEPKERASFYFAQNVGSILEKDSQRGLAHFLEHMAFNGTEHFPDKEMLEYLEKNGLRFGGEINAFTSFEKTVYNMSNVPTTNPQLLDSVLLALYDWSGSISLLDDEIDKERGVINEEWRSRNTARYRASEKVWTQGLLKGSVYAERIPIGLMSVVNNFTYDELRDYYKRWYRPDLQALIVVGDIDVEEMEKKIIALFSTIPLRENLPKRKSFEVPDQEEDLIFIEALDKELASISVEYYIKNDAAQLTGKTHIDNMVKESIASYVINNRFEAFTFNEDCPALGIGYSSFDFVRPLNVMSLNVRPRKGKIQEAFEFALTEFTRFVEHGATEQELQRAKSAIKSSYISYLKNKASIGNDSYAKQLYTYFLKGDPFPSVEWKVDYVLNKIGSISNEDLIGYLAPRFNQDNDVLAVKGNSGADYPAKAEFVRTVNEIKAKELSKYEEETINKKLITQNLPGSKIKKTFAVGNIGAKGYELENGATVVVYATPFEKDQISVHGFSKGGKSLIDKAYLPSAGLATYVASQSGLGELNKIALAKKLAGTKTSLSLGIGETSEVLRGNSTKTDIEVLFKEIYLSFEAPRFEKNAFDHVMERMKKSLKRKNQNIKSAWQDSLTLAKTGHSERTFLFTEELLQEFDLKDMEHIYTNRFRNANDFTFVFVGDIDEKKLMVLAQKYIGSIGSGKTTEDYIDHHTGPADGKTVVAVSEEMETPQTTVSIMFTGDMAYTIKNKMTMNVLGQLLSKRYLEVIREQEGGSYGVGASGYLQKVPNEKYTLGIGFNCNPEMSDRLVAVVYDEIAKLQEAVNEADLHEIKESLIKSREEQLRKNSYWMGAISNHISMGTEILSLEDYVALVKGIDKKDIKKTAKMVLEDSDIVEGVLSPI